MRANGVEIRINRFLEVDPAMQRTIQAQFERTLGLLPRAHLVSLQYIDIRQARDGQGEERMSTENGVERSYAGGSIMPLRCVSPDDGCSPTSPNHMIAIDIDGFDRRRRPLNGGGDGFNYTLLHETGHVVDKHFKGIEWLTDNHPTGLAAMLAHPHSGATQGASEHFADAYADFYYRGLTRSSDSRMEGLVAFLEAKALPLHPAQAATTSSRADASAGGMPLTAGF